MYENCIFDDLRRRHNISSPRVFRDYSWPSQSRHKITDWAEGAGWSTSIPKPGRYPHGGGSPDRHMAELYVLKIDPGEYKNLIMTKPIWML
ncbi:MAG: hypothetical protein KDB22_05480 [Planctomycetales bacterium]|nr:hypothetical protein [Planctomycetales bacterium]